MVCVACLPNKITGIISSKAGGKDAPEILHVLLPAYRQEVCTAGLHSGLHSLYLQIHGADQHLSCSINVPNQDTDNPGTSVRLNQLAGDVKPPPACNV